MRLKILVSAFLLLAALVAGCGLMDERGEVEPAPSGVAGEKLEVAAAATQVAAQAMKGYAFAQRAKFVSDRKAEMVKMQAELEQLSVKAESANDAMKLDAGARLDVVRGQWTVAMASLDRAASATEADWNAVQTGFDDSYGELKESIDQTRQLLSDKIEP